MLDVLVVTPFERPDPALIRALQHAPCTPILDLGRDARRGRRALASLRGAVFGVRIPEGSGWRPEDLGPDVHTVVCTGPTDPSAWGDRRVLIEVRTVAEARDALAAGAAGVIGRGAEAGGRVGPENAFVLCQRLADADLPGPWWIQGGIGARSAAAAAVCGAHGIVLDAQVALAEESTLPLPVQRAVRSMDGSETVVVAGWRVFTRPDLDVAKAPPDTVDAVLARLGAGDLHRDLVPIGQDAALAAALAGRWRTAGGIVRGIAGAVASALAAAADHDPFTADSPVARDQGTPTPIAQGPMTRVSDVAGFAAAVAEGGALPFIALSLLRGDQADALLQETAAACGDRPWGAGILGFAPPEVRGPQLDAIARVRPPFALIAGGRPSQARALEEAGTPAYLHCPSPALLDAFLADGARRFVFEGSECGGHVGPRSSFVLWEQQLARLEAFGDPGSVRALFAGGVHDGRSAAMVAAMAGAWLAMGGGVGVLMGTAYLFTEEAVSTGAILPGFQEAALRAQTTALLETAPGHATRCVDTAFVEAFRVERARLQAEGVPSKEIWERLEQLNLGRLRIASKGLVRGPDGLRTVDAATQQAEGMYMIGQVAALRGTVTTIAALHADVCEGARARLASYAADAVEPDGARPVDIAIVGMACVFPDAPDVETYWQHILDGHDAVREIPSERWDPAIHYAADGVPGETTPSRWGGMLPSIRFDPLRYGIPPRSMGSIDPAQLVALDVARRALDDAGYADRPFPRERTSVIFGTESGSDLGTAYGFRALYPHYVGPIPDALDAVLPRMSEDSFPGVLANVLAGRIANRLDLGGVNYTVDAACASSLAAVDLAVKELVGGTSDMVVCGGADLHNGVHDYLLFSSVHALSPTGRCQTFDASADGIVLGEGVAAVVLKRLEDAQRDGDRIYAVLRSVAGSSDGKSLGLTAPRKEGQMRAVERAWKRAGVPVATVGLVEAHGTGTVVGDRTELRTLEESFAGQASDVLLGSVKSQIGHTKCAAGLAGLIKVALAVHHGVRPGMAPIKQPNGAWDAEHSPFHFSSRARPWARTRRVAGVSAFGFGGTNFHAIVDAADPIPRAPRVRPAELFLLRGTDAGVDRVLDLLAARLDDAEPPSLAALALAACEVGEGPVRVAIVADGHAALRTAVSAARTRTPVDGSVWIAEGAEAGPVAFLFPGQGSQRPHMLADLFVAMPSLQGLLVSDADLARVMFPSDAYDDASRAAQRAAITDTRVAQPALGVADLAAATFLEQCGVTAAMAGGHSYGELAALCWAGALDEGALLPLSRARAACILDAAPSDPGTMAAVRGPADAVEVAIAGMEGVVIANLNAPQQTVIAGPTDAVEAAVAALGEAGFTARTIPVAAAFHSPLVAGASDTFAEALAAIAWRAPSVPVWSNASGTPHPADAEGIRRLLARQVAEPVRFVDQIEGMYAAGARVFVETGPGRVLTGLVGRILGDRPHRAVAFDVPGEPGWAAHLGALAALATAGVAVDAAPLFADRGLRRVALDAPPPRAAAPWWVNGHRAWPVVGEPPPGSLVPVPVPVGAQFAPAAGAHAADDREQAVLSFLDNMRALADAQRDVVLGLMGQAPSAPRTVSAGPAPRAAARVIDATPAVRHDDAPPPRVSAPTDLLGTLLSVVSERTGYPAEMLDPDLDLEADLSIDSIKRIEILNAFGTRLSAGGAPTLDDRALEELATRRTLRAIVDVLDARGVGAASVAPASDAPVDVLATLLTVVSERTGYPSEMLDPDLDLEADLSIDSIKRIEILNALGTALGGAARLDDAALEQLATERTLRGIVTRLDAARGGASASPVEVPSSSPAADSALRRFKLVARPAPIDVPDDLAAAVLPFTLVDADPARGAKIQAALAARGIDVEVITPERAGGQQAVVHVDGAGAAAVFPHLTRLLESGTRTIVGVDTGEDGLDGLFKTAAREYPDRTVRLVTVDGPIDVDALADTVRPELCLTGGPTHVRYRDGVREVGAVEPAPFDAAPGPLPLDADSVVLITGGARGITARIAMALAAEVPCHFVLVGRSALPGPEEDDLAVARDAAGLRKALLARGMTSPADIERAVQGVLKGREARATIAAIEARGATVAYHAVDVRDAEAFEALAQQVIAQHGRIDGVVHGAGILEDRLMRDKSPDSFARVYETKVAAARVLARILPDTTRFVVFFGSISGVLGNRGQADYASANATLDALARSLGARITGRVVSIDWGPWGGAGMVSDALARAYAQRGIGLIDVDEGVAAFLDELRRGRHDDHQVIWQAGDPRAFAGNADGA